jgi:hypothetical protein
MGGPQRHYQSRLMKISPSDTGKDAQKGFKDAFETLKLVIGRYSTETYCNRSSRLFAWRQGIRTSSPLAEAKASFSKPSRMSLPG